MKDKISTPEVGLLEIKVEDTSNSLVNILRKVRPTENGDRASQIKYGTPS